jgi:hypothetical protein
MVELELRAPSESLELALPARAAGNAAIAVISADQPAGAG